MKVNCIGGGNVQSAANPANTTPMTKPAIVIDVLDLPALFSRTTVESSLA